MMAENMEIRLNQSKSLPLQELLGEAYPGVRMQVSKNRVYVMISPHTSSVLLFAKNVSDICSVENLTPLFILFIYFI